MENVVSVDVEHWYHRPVLKDHIRGPDLDQNHITASVRQILGILRKHGKRTTFFILGDVAEKNPGIIERIMEESHEIACHGYSHHPLKKLTKGIFDEELKNGISLLRHITGERPQGFRSPLFSLNRETSWALKCLTASGFRYDSSVFPMGTSTTQTPDSVYRPSLENPREEDPEQSSIVEFPVLTRSGFGLRLPAGGGFYLRLFGAEYTINAVKRLNSKGHPAMCYVHPWEVSGFPQVVLPLHKRLFAYHNIPCMEGFEKLVRHLDMLPAIEVLEKMGYL